MKPGPKYTDLMTRPRSSPGAPGKGDAPRRGADRKKFVENYDLIDWRTPDTTIQLKPAVPLVTNYDEFDAWFSNPANVPLWRKLLIGSIDTGEFQVWARRCFEAGRWAGCKRKHTEK